MVLAKKKRILIVEDHADMQTLYKRMLGDRFDLVQVTDTKSAMDEMRKDGVDLVVLDLILPDDMGDSFFVHMRLVSEFEKLPVIVVTVLAGVEDQLRQIDPDVGYLVKPFKKEQLVKLIEEKLKK